MKTAKRIRRFIDTELLSAPYAGEDALADGLLDSLDIEQLIAHLEESCGVSFDDDEIVAENFSSVTALAALVDAKRT